MYFVAKYWQEHIGSCRDSTNHESGLVYLSKPVFVVQPDNETTLEAAEWTTRSQTSRKTRTHRNNGDRNPPIALDRRDTNGNA